MSRKDLKKYTTQAMKLEDGPIPEAVFLPPAIRGRFVKTRFEAAHPKTDIKQHVARINDETDPVGLLIAIANGQPVPTVTVDKNGDSTVSWETLPLKDRIPVIKFLSDKVLPRMSVFRRMDKGETGDEGQWGALLSNAAEKAGD